MEGVVEDLEQNHEELREDVNQLKAQIGQILEMLKSMEFRRVVNEGSSQEPQATPAHPPAFTPLPTSVPRMPTTVPSYGMPPNYVPPTTEPVHPPIATHPDNPQV